MIALKSGTKEIGRVTGLTVKEVKDAWERVRQKGKGFRRWEEERRLNYSANVGKILQSN